MRARCTRFVVTALLALGAAGCSASTSARPGPTFSPGPDTSQLVARAALDPCPTTTSGRAPHSLPALTLPCLGTGPAVRLAGLRGLPTVVNIWGTWCGPCQKETPHLASVYDANKTRVRFLGVDTEDDARSALDFAAHVQPAMHYPQVVDNDKKLLVGLHLPSAVPTTVFVTADGRVVHVQPGPYASAAALRRDIQRYLGVPVT